MSAPAPEATPHQAEPARRLVVTLPGTWLQLDPREPAASHRRIGTFVEHAVGRADALVQLRAALREALGTLLDRASADSGAGQAESVFVCDEISKGVKLPLCLTVFAPDRMRVAPSIGTDPDAVISAFHEALETIGEGADWVRVPCRDGLAVRRVRITEQALAEEAPDATARTWTADYWRTIPESKHLMLVTATSPLADVPETLVRLTDAIMAGSRCLTGLRPSEVIAAASAQ